MGEVWQYIVVAVCVVLSGTFSGTTLGLFSLAKSDLLILKKIGTTDQRRFAKKVLPIRAKGNRLLTTLLLGNTAVNAGLSILTSDLFGGWAGFVASTVIILYLGEIIPQAFCHKNGLVVAAWLAPFINFVCFILVPIAWPTSVVLNKMIGEQEDPLYDRPQLELLLRMHADPDDEGFLGEFEGEKKRHRDTSSDSDGQPQFLASQKELQESTASIAMDDAIFEKAQLNPNGTCLHPLSNSMDDLDADLPLGPTADPEEGLDSVREGVEGNAAASKARNGTSSSSDEIGGMDNEPEQTGRSRVGGFFKGLKQSVAIGMLAILALLPLSSSASSSSSSSSSSGSSRKKRTPQLEPIEYRFLSAILNLHKKLVSWIMTSIEDTFMLECTTVLDKEARRLIHSTGHSRIPVYRDSKENIIGLVLVKDLIVSDSTDNRTVESIMDEFDRRMFTVLKSTKVMKMIPFFRRGFAHIAVVKAPVDEDEDDDDENVDGDDNIDQGYDSDIEGNTRSAYTQDVQDRSRIGQSMVQRLKQNISSLWGGKAEKAKNVEKAPERAEEGSIATAGKEEGRISRAARRLSITRGRKSRPKSTGPRRYKTVGIVTLEDAIEELIGSEIIDETDVYYDNKGRRKVRRKSKNRPNPGMHQGDLSEVPVEPLDTAAPLMEARSKANPVMAQTIMADSSEGQEVQ